MIRRIAAFVLLPFAALSIYAGWYGHRAVVFSYFVSDLALDYKIVGPAFSFGVATALVGVVVGGLLSVAIGARGVLVVAILGTASSVALFAVSEAFVAVDPRSIYVLFALAAFWQGMIGPALYATAADSMQGEWGALRTAALAALYGAVNASASVASLVADAMGRGIGYPVTFAVCGAMIAAAVLIPIALMVAPADPPEDDPANAFVPERLGLSVGLIVLLAAPTAVHWHVSSQWWRIGEAIGTHHGVVNSTLMMSLNPLVIAAATPVLVMVMIAFAITRVPVPDLAPAGIALLLSGVSSVALTLDPLVAEPMVFVVAVIVGSVGELLLAAFLMSRILGDAHWRATMALACAWMFVSRAGPMMMQFAVPQNDMGALPQWIIWVDVGLSTAAGVVLLVAAWPVYQWLLPDGDGDGESDGEGDSERDGESDGESDGDGDADGDGERDGAVRPES